MGVALTKRKDTSPKPPRPLGKFGTALWAEVHNEYSIDDVGSIQLLTLACECLDRAEQCRVEIEKAGIMITTSNGSKRDNPVLRFELQNRQFCARLISQLGLDVEPIGKVGRPPGPTTASLRAV